MTWWRWRYSQNGGQGKLLFLGHDSKLYCILLSFFSKAVKVQADDKKVKAKEMENPFYNKEKEEGQEESDKDTLPEPVSVTKTSAVDNKNDCRKGTESRDESAAEDNVQTIVLKAKNIEVGDTNSEKELDRNGEDTEEDLLELEVNPDEFEDLGVEVANSSQDTETSVEQAEEEEIEIIEHVVNLKEMDDDGPPGEERSIALPAEKIVSSKEEIVPPVDTKNLTLEQRQQIIKECVEDMISPTELAIKWNCNSDTIRTWVRKAGLTLPKQYKCIPQNGAIPGEEVISPGGGELVCPPGEEPVLLPAPVRVKHGEEAKSDDPQDAKVCGQFIMESGEWSIFHSSAIKRVLIVSDICLV